MNSFEARRARRIARMRYLAEKSRERSEQYDKQARQISSYIPFGQPILIGHHSEGRHRRDLARIHRYTEQSITEYEKAKYYDNRAESAESNRSISSDDPQAAQKIRERIAALEKNQTVMREANKAIRKNDDAALLSLGFTSEQIIKLKTPDFMKRIGFPAYSLTNNNNNIRRLKLRLADLERRAVAESKEKTIGDVRILDNVDENRVQVFFPGKPDESIRTMLKQNGFRWSPYNGCWQRMRGNWSYDRAIQLIEGTAAKAA